MIHAAHASRHHWAAVGGDFDLAYALEAIARGYGVAGEVPEAEAYAALAAEAGERIADAEDREHFERDLAALG